MRGGKKHKLAKLPNPTIRRYPVYLREIFAIMNAGGKYVSSASLAERLGQDSVLTRKDLAMTGVIGKPRLGYDTKEISAAILKALGWDKPSQAALVGVGHLGRALLGYTGFAEQKITVSYAFDADPAKIGEVVSGVEILDIAKLEDKLADGSTKLAILAVPDSAAQQCADALAKTPVKGILNFSHVLLTVPRHIRAQNVDLAQPLALLSHQILSD